MALMRDNVPCGMKHSNAFLHHTPHDITASSWKEPYDDSLRYMTTPSTSGFSSLTLSLSLSFGTLALAFCVIPTRLV